MYYNKGDKVVYVRKTERQVHKLIINKVYEIYDILEHLGVPRDEQKLYYGVIDNNTVTTWYEKEDFMTLSEFRIKSRKEKLKRIKNGNM